MCQSQEAQLYVIINSEIHLEFSLKLSVHVEKCKSKYWGITKILNTTFSFETYMKFRQKLFLLISVGLKECIVKPEYNWDTMRLSVCAVPVERNSREAQKKLTCISMSPSKTT